MISQIYLIIYGEAACPALDAVEEQRQEYFNSYIETYLMRDVSDEGGITDTVRFRRFLNACAALTAEQVNYSTLAKRRIFLNPLQKRGFFFWKVLGLLPVEALCQ